MKAVLFALLALLALLATRDAAASADLGGGWKGAWTKDGDALPVTVSFEKSATGYSGAFDSDALQVASIPFANVTETNGKLHWLLKGDETTSVFDGSLNGDALDGTFTEGATKGSFALTRADLPGDKIASRDVTFANGDVMLAGTLSLSATRGPHAAIVFLQGSGPEGRWANRWLARKFAASGIAALIFDKRGVGASTGDWKTAGFDTLAGDALAGLRFLRTQKEIDPARIGIYGHSQGGMIAPMVAVKDGHLAFVIASAAAGIDLADVERYSVGNSIGIRALPPAERVDADTYVAALIDVAYRGKSRATLDTLAAKFKSRSWYFDPPPPGNSYWTLSRQFASFRPSMWWKQVKAPVLLLYGGHDERVQPMPNAEAIRNALFVGGNTRVTLKLYPNADHTFTIVEPPRKGGWPEKVRNYGNAVVGWVAAIER